MIAEDISVWASLSQGAPSMSAEILRRLVFFLDVASEPSVALTPESCVVVALLCHLPLRPFAPAGPP